jgi:hypothetical protein
MTTRIHADTIIKGIRLRTVQLKIMNMMTEYHHTNDVEEFDGFDLRLADQKFLKKILKDKEIWKFITEYYKNDPATNVKNMSPIEICGEFLAEGIGV